MHKFHILLVLILVIIIGDITHGLGVAGRNTQKKNKYRAKENECADKCTSDLGPSAQQYEITRCTNECISPECYKYYFVDYELEEGEVDMRHEHFVRCTSDGGVRKSS
jgi:hypothetical protein